MGPQYHITGAKSDSGRGMGCTVVENLGDCTHGCLSAVGMVSGEGAQCSEQRAVNGAGIVEQDPNDFLYPLLVSDIQGRGSVGWLGVLDFGTVHGLLPCKWAVFWDRGHRMLESHQNAVNVSGHGGVNSAVGVVPCEGETTVAGSILVNFDVIFGL